MAKRPTKVQVNARINSLLVKRLDEVAERMLRNRSEMIERAIETYLRHHAEKDVAAIEEALKKMQ